MKFLVKEPGLPQREVDGAEARGLVRLLYADIGRRILMPIMPHTGKLRCRVKRQLQAGQPVWTHPDHHGQITPRSMIMVRVMPILGVIDGKGAVHIFGEDGKTTTPVAAQTAASDDEAS